MTAEMTATGPSALASSIAALLDDFSIEMTGKDVANLADARASIPAGTRINLTYLGHENLAVRLAAAERIKQYGFVPVPHISARRLGSVDVLEQFLDGLKDLDAVENVFVVGGDPAEPEGPFADAHSVIRTGLLQRAGATSIGVAGYPDGHPHITEEALWSALDAKVETLAAQGTPGTIVTQFGFDVDVVLAWIEATRARGIDLPIRVGVPGPAGVKRLLAYASRFGVSTSAGIVKKYGFSITNLIGTPGPDTFVRELAERYDRAVHGEVKIHFYTFGGLKATAEWVQSFRKEHRA